MLPSHLAGLGSSMIVTAAFLAKSGSLMIERTRRRGFGQVFFVWILHRVGRLAPARLLGRWLAAKIRFPPQFHDTVS